MSKPTNRHVYTVQYRVLTQKIGRALAPNPTEQKCAMVVWTPGATVAEITMVHPGGVTRAQYAVLFLYKKL